jgi:predicted MFS family arabinose efflux permease
VVKSRAYGLYVLGLLAACNLLNYAHRNVLAPVYDDLRAHYHFTNDELGLLGAAYMLAHALATLPIGWAGDRHDRRRLIAAGAVLWSVAAALGTLATGLGTMLLTRILVGLGTAAVVPVANTMLAELFPARDKAFTISIFNLGLFLGGAVGFGLGSAVGFPAAWLALAAPGIIAAALIVVLDVPGRRVGGPPPHSDLRTFVAQSRELLRRPTLRWVMAATASMAFAAGGYLFWFLDFLHLSKGLSKEGASGLFGLALVGGLAGVICGGRVADALRRRWTAGRLITISLGMGLTVPFALAAIFLPPGPGLDVAAIGTMFFISWYHGPMAASVDDLAPDDRAATAQSLVIFNMHLFGTAPAVWVVGKVSAVWDLQIAMLVPTAAVAVAALLMTRAWPSFADDTAAAHAPPPGGERSAAAL